MAPPGAEQKDKKERKKDAVVENQRLTSKSPYKAVARDLRAHPWAGSPRSSCLACCWRMAQRIAAPLIPTGPSLPRVLGPVKDWPGNDVTWRTTRRRPSLT